MATTAQIPSKVFSAIATAKAKMGLLPLNARKGHLVSVTKEQVEELGRHGNTGAIKGLLSAGGMRILTEYKCIIPASEKDKLDPYTYVKDGVEKTMYFPRFEGTEDAEEIILAELPMTE